MSDYELWLTSNVGTREALLGDFTKCSYSRRTNDVGWLSLTVPTSYYSQLARDKRIEVWRQAVDGGTWYLDMNTAWMIRKFSRVLDGSGQQMVNIGAFSTSFLLNTRIAAYYSGSSQAQKTGYADDLMKAIVRENLGNLATDTARDLSTYLSILADTSAGQSLSKGFSRRNVLAVLQELADSSADLGTHLFFDITYDVTNGLRFVTYPNQLGTDRSATVTFSAELGNLTDTVYEIDYTDETTFAYALGQGEGISRAVETASDATRIAESPFNRVEKAIDARQTDDTASLTAEAQGAIHAGLPVYRFEGKVQQTPSLIYGRDYFWGDLVTAEFGGTSLTAWLDATKVSIDGGNDTVDIDIRKVQ